MPDVVVDASAIIAVIKGEAGAQRAAESAQGARMSALNYCEIVGWLAERGSTAIDVESVIAPFNLTVEDFSRARALAAGLLTAKTKGRNISLADRACIALAVELGLPAMTGDRIWRDLGLDVDIELIR
jgi:PIN domain nuclease of toxin-antitoxin system